MKLHCVLVAGLAQGLPLPAHDRALDREDVEGIALREGANPDLPQGWSCAGVARAEPET